MDYKHPIEIYHWDYMAALLPVLALFKRTSKYLEAEEAMEIVQERAADA